MLTTDLQTLEPYDAHVPDWPPESLFDRACPGCQGSHPPLLRRPDSLPLAFCTNCHLWYVCVAPDEHTLEDFYTNYWSEHRPVPMDRIAAVAVKEQASAEAPVDPRICRLEALMPLAGRGVLDIGCGTGLDLLKVRAYGAIPIGMDVSQEACSFVRRQFREVAVYDGRIERTKPKENVDAVMMMDLLEHPLDVNSLLTAAIDLLPPGGLLLIWTPNGGEAGADTQSALRWIGFRVNLEHMQYYSPAGMLVLAERYGLSVEHLETVGFAQTNGLQKKRSRPVRASLRALGRFPLVQRLRARISGPNSAFSRLGTYHLFAILRRQ